MLFVEPGYYEDGKFGIRLENIERVVPAETKYNLPIRKFLTFETVTMVPIQTKMLMPELLTEKEVHLYLFTYHNFYAESASQQVKINFILFPIRYPTSTTIT